MPLPRSVIRRARQEDYRRECDDFYGPPDPLCACGKRKSDHDLGDFVVLGTLDGKCQKFVPAEVSK
jgi:hypothetical protein